MKIRTDYVSNSSSSSFVICGKIFDKDEVLNSSCFDKKIVEDYNNGDIDSWELFDNIENATNKLGLNIQTSGYDGDIEQFCIGLDPNEMKDSETLKEFKQKVIEKVKELGLDIKQNEVSFVSGGSDAGGCSFFESCG